MLLHKTKHALQKRQKTENTENEDKWDTREREQRIKQGVGIYVSTFLSVFQPVDRKCLTIRCTLVKIPPFNPFLPGESRKACTGRFNTWYRLKMTFYSEAMQKKRERQREGWKERQRIEIQYTGFEEMNVLGGICLAGIHVVCSNGLIKERAGG